MSFHDAYRIDIDAATIEIAGGVKITVRRLGCKEAQAARRKLTKPYRHMQEVPETVQDQITNKVLAQAVLVGWEGMTDKDGAVIPFSTEAALKQIEAYPHFRDDVITAANSREAFQVEQTEATRGN